MLLAKHTINYGAVLATAKAEGGLDPALALEQRLPSLWRDVYIRTITHEPYLVRIRQRTLEYICDLYSQLEFAGGVPIDQTIADRVIGVFGRSATVEEGCVRRQSKIVLSELLEGTRRDDGHFMARSIGGGLQINLFSQDRWLNRGWSTRGKIYRQMEKYCRDQKGTFCFSRPIYEDGSNVPRWLEFGVVKDDDTLWVEVFDN